MAGCGGKWQDLAMTAITEATRQETVNSVREWQNGRKLQEMAGSSLMQLEISETQATTQETVMIGRASQELTEDFV